jgi:F0F1-type ATP synthase membrane subunit b/b'
MNLVEARLRISRLSAELDEAKRLREDAARLLVCYEQMRGQVMSMTQSIASLKRENPEAWERHFSKRARRERKITASPPPAQGTLGSSPSVGECPDAR